MGFEARRVEVGLGQVRRVLVRFAMAGSGQARQGFRGLAGLGKARSGWVR